MRVDPATLEPRFKVIGCDLWSNETGFAEATRRIGVTGICGSGIIEALAEMYLAGIIRSDGTIDGAKAAQSPRVQPDGRTFSYLLRAGEPEIRIVQNDVRAIQLAKAALYAGARLLMDHLGVDRVDRITLAGAFGSHIDVKYAMILGLIPDCDLAKVSSAGNAAGTGARIALLNQGRGPRSSRWCAGSRRSRPRSSRAFRSTSWAPWRSRTRAPPTPTWPRSWRCRAEREGGRAGEVGGRRRRRG